MVVMSSQVGSAVTSGSSGYGHPTIISSTMRAEMTIVVVYEGLLGS
jgi:hypothetical protein